MANNAIGILFEVQGGGDINGASGKRINGQLRNLIGQINKSDTVKLKFQIDSNYFNQQIKQLQQQLQSLSAGGSQSGGGGKGSSQASQTQQQTKAYREATKAVQEYYDALTKYERRASRNANAETEYSALHQSLDMARQKAEQYFNLVDGEFQGIKDSISGLTEEQVKMLQTFESARSMKFDADFTDIQNNAENAWSGLTAKVHDYISRVEEAASRNKKAADSLKELRDMANSTDYRGYDKLKQKLSEVQQYINKNALATETWGQKMIKTFGSRVRSALAGIIVAKVGQYIKEVYENVVELDKALVNLQIASGKTREETKHLIQEYANLAKQLGATTTEVAEGADTWLRQGYSIEDANILITNSTMLSKLGQMEAADAATALTSAMKGYNVTAEDSIRIIDKFTAVDMAAAASAGDIATAMSETATSARIAGVSMDRLIGYIATVKEVTQDGAESVGTFYKTLFARMNNVAAGNFIDEETGESLNDVETVLNKLKIKLRDVNGEFRNSGEVLDEVAERWNTFDSVAKHAIATAFAGTRQQEKFTTLMEHYGEAMEYAGIATDSAGTAVEKYDAWLQGIEGRLNSLKTTFQTLSMAILDSEVITGTIEFITWLLEALTWLVDKLGGLNTVLCITAGLILTIKLDSIVGIVKKLIGLIPSLITMIVKFSTTLKTARGHGSTLGSALSSAFNSIGISASAAQIAVGAFVAVISAAIIAVNLYNSSVQESINNSLKAANAANQEGKEYLDTAKSLKELVDEYEALAEASEGGVFDNEAAEKVRSIQNKITDLVGDQADNLDLVNGKLDDEIRKMRELATGTGGAVDNAIKKGNTQIAEATNSYKKMVGSAFAPHYNIGDALITHLWGAWESGGLTDFTKEWTDQFNVELQKNPIFSEGLFGMEKGYLYAFKTEFDTIEEFAKQYEGISAMYEELSAEHGESELFKTASTFLEDYKRIYETYMSGKLLIEEANKVKDEVNDLFAEPEDNGVTVALKSAYEILEEVQDGYDGLASALTDVTSEGYLTADALATLFKLEKDNALAGLELADILTQDANGYKLASNALEQYITKIIEAQKAQYAAITMFASEEDKQNAIDNINAYIGVLTTLIATTATAEDSADASIKAQREALEAEQEMYENQRDAFEELIDARKELLRTYADELSYQKELEKKQKTVSSLQQKLAVARLDSSAAGRARARKLEAELEEAQEDLDDFTLEHAIDVLIAQLDAESAENEAFFKTHLERIEGLLNGLDTSIEVNVDIDTSWATSLIDVLDALRLKIEGLGTGDDPDPDSELKPQVGVGTAIQAGVAAIIGGQAPTTPPTTTQSGFRDSSTIREHNETASIPTKEMKKSGWTYTNLFGLGGGTYTATEYKSRIVKGTDGAIYLRLKDLAQDESNGGYSKLGEGYDYELDANGNYKVDAFWWKPTYHYHKGGLVGNIATLSSSEEFAKLLKGEFVSTPAQMHRFMKKTLPEMASSGGTRNEFNAPLITIECDNVTSEAMPKLQNVVDEAVKEVKKQLDSGMSRVGHKKTAKKLLI